MNFKPLAVSDYDTLKPFFAEQPYNLSHIFASPSHRME